MLDLGWEVLTHPPYSPDLAPTDYHLFRYLSNSLRDKKFEEYEDIQKFVPDFFDSKQIEFYSRGIHMLHTQWQQVIDNDGSYIVFVIKMSYNFLANLILF